MLVKTTQYKSSGISSANLLRALEILDLPPAISPELNKCPGSNPVTTEIPRCFLSHVVCITIEQDYKSNNNQTRKSQSCLIWVSHCPTTFMALDDSILVPSILSIHCTLMHASKGILNLHTSSLHLCSPFQQNRLVKIHHQFTFFSVTIGSRFTTAKIKLGKD